MEASQIVMQLILYIFPHVVMDWFFVVIDLIDSFQYFTLVMQKSIVPENQGGVRYTVTTYPTQHIDTHAIRLPSISPAVTPFVHQPFLAPLAGVPMANPVQATPSSSPVVGTTDLRYCLWNSWKPSKKSDRITMWLNQTGSLLQELIQDLQCSCSIDHLLQWFGVCVWQHFSREGIPSAALTLIVFSLLSALSIHSNFVHQWIQAQAIMLLAGNGPPMTPKATAPVPPVQTSMPRSSVLDRLTISQPYVTTPHRSSPVQVTPISISQSAGRTGIKTDTSTAKPSGVLVSSPIIAEPLKSVHPLGSANFLSSGTP